VSYAAKIGKAEARLDFTQPARQVHDRVRALSPAPGAWFELAHERIKVLQTALVPGLGPPGRVLDDRLTIACGEGAVRALTLQRAGKRPTATAEFLRGYPLPEGTCLTAP
jgi:methionyl-tRNA formyltransferase